MKVLTVIFSYNTPARTIRCYNELLLHKPDWHDLLILDNSSSDELIPRTPHTTHLGKENRGHGGMIDFVLNDLLHCGTNPGGYGLVGMINNDTYDYAPRFIETLVDAVAGIPVHRLGIISPAIKQGGTVWPTMQKQGHEPARQTNFIETIAPWYGPRLLCDMAKLCPMEYFGYIDRAVSIRAKMLGLQNVVVDSLEIFHEAGKAREELGTQQDVHARWRTSVKAWYDSHAELKGLDEIWPEEINSSDWKQYVPKTDEAAVAPVPDGVGTAAGRVY